MRRFVALLCAILLIFSCAVTAFGALTATLSLDVGTVSQNRLFEMGISIDSDSYISGGQLILTYDNAVIEYRDVSSEVYEVSAKDKGDSLHIAFACPDKVDCKDATSVITVKFKCIGSGESDVTLSSAQCVDCDFNNVVVDAVTSTLSVSSKSVKIAITSSTKDKTSVSGEKSQISENIDDSEKTEHSYSFVSGIDNTTTSVLVGVGVAVILILLFVIGVLLGRKSDPTIKMKNRQDDIIKDKED